MTLPAIPETASHSPAHCWNASSRRGIVGCDAPAGNAEAHSLLASAPPAALSKHWKAMLASAAKPSSKSGGQIRTSALLELRANARLLRAAVRAVSDRPRVIARLPRVVFRHEKDEPRAAAIAYGLSSRRRRKVLCAGFPRFDPRVAGHDPLTLDELWNAAAFLKFTLLELLLEDARILLRSPGSAPGSSVPAHLKSLRTVTHTDWAYLMEPLILFDAALRQDPAQAYAAMDFDSREFYRKRVAFIARHSDCTESQVAQAALDLAREGAGGAQPPTRACNAAESTLAITSSTKDSRNWPRAPDSILR